MTRYTIDHGGKRLVPRALWPEAMELLARYEDTEMGPLEIVRLAEAYEEKCREVADLKAKHDKQVAKYKCYLNWLAGRVDISDPVHEAKKKVEELL